MAEFLVQRFIPNAPNESTGAWVDVGTVADLKADEAQAAIDQLATSPGRHRVSRWDTTEEFQTAAGPVDSSKVAKNAETPP